MENRYLIQMDTRLGWLNKNVIEFNKLSIGTCLLEFELTDNRVPFDLDNKRVMIEVLTPSGSTVEEPVKLIDTTTGKFEKELIAEMITEQGMHYLELSIYNEDDTKLLVTGKARYSVGENYGEKNVTVSSQYSTLQECIMQTKEVQTSVDGNAQIVEQAKDLATQSASNSIQSSIASQESANSAQEASAAVDNILELAKQSAEASKQSAESSKASADESERAKNVALKASEVANQSSVTANQASINAEKALQDTVTARTNAQQSEASARNSAIEAGMAETSANNSKAILEAKIAEVETVKNRVDETVSTANQANSTANTNLSQIASLTETNNVLIDVATTNTIKAEQAIKDANNTKLAVDQAVIDATEQANRSKSEADRAQAISDSIGNVDERFEAIESKNVEQDTNLTCKYDDVTANIEAGTLTFKAEGVDKKTVQVGSATVASDKVKFEDGESLTDKHNEIDSRIDSKVTIGGVGKQNFNFISTTIPTPTSKSYGIKVDLDANTITRLGDATGKALDDFYNFYPWAAMRREVVDGQYMVRIPRFYYKRVPIKTETIPQSADGNEMGKQLVVWEDWISPTPQDGYFVHPTFVRGGKIHDDIWISAFEGSIYDVSANTYLLEDEQVADFNNDLLCSIPNAKPCSGKTQNLTIEMARKLANNRNINSNFEWMQQDFTLVSAIQSLIVVATGSYDCQTTIGRGVVDLSDNPNTENNSLRTGATLQMGIRCGNAGENGKSSVNFFGIENFWGNIWKFVDDFVIEAKGIHNGYTSGGDDLVVNTTTNKDNLGFTIAKANGYMSRIGWDDNLDFTFIPTATKSGEPISTDYFYQNASYNGFLIARLGGYWTYGSDAGCFCWSVHAAASARTRAIGARLACIRKSHN